MKNTTHEVNASQHELGMYFETLTNQADNVQLYKYAVQMVTFIRKNTFMPKPVKGDTDQYTVAINMERHTPLFMGKEYAGLSKEVFYYIGKF